MSGVSRATYAGTCNAQVLNARQENESQFVDSARFVRVGNAVLQLSLADVTTKVWHPMFPLVRRRTLLD